jgi:hypothetical protein
MMSEPTSDEDLSEAIRDLVKRGELDEGSPAYGAALKAIHGGYSSLTRMQRALYDKTIVPALQRRAEGLPSDPAKGGRSEK